MVWSPYQASGIDNSIFTAVNYNHYNPPPGIELINIYIISLQKALY